MGNEAKQVGEAIHLAVSANAVLCSQRVRSGARVVSATRNLKEVTCLKCEGAIRKLRPMFRAATARAGEGVTR